ncbi:MAG: PilZ domain-containing protein [Arenicellales bacterium]|nr:PilZ domain-containing protein [Arenicellales bacterium]
MTEKSEHKASKPPADVSAKAARPRVLSVSIKDVRTLTAAFMPFLKKRGLFVPTETDYAMGDEVFLVLKLLETEQFAVAGTVAWLTPSGAQSSRTKGIGVHFKGADAEKLNERIEELIKGVGLRRNATHTL